MLHSMDHQLSDTVPLTVLPVLHSLAPQQHLRLLRHQWRTLPSKETCLDEAHWREQRATASRFSRAWSVRERIYACEDWYCRGRFADPLLMRRSSYVGEFCGSCVRWLLSRGGHRGAVVDLSIGELSKADGGPTPGIRTAHPQMIRLRIKSLSDQLRPRQGPVRTAHPQVTRLVQRQQSARAVSSVRRNLMRMLHRLAPQQHLRLLRQHWRRYPCLARELRLRRQDGEKEGFVELGMDSSTHKENSVNTMVVT